MRLLKNFLSLAGAEAASKVVTFAAFAYLARVAGADGFGYLEFAGAALFCAGLLVEQGFGPYGAREIAKAPRRTAELVKEIVLARALLAVMAYLGLITLALWLNRAPIVTRLLLIYGLSLLAMPLLLQWVFQGHDRMGVVAAAQIIRQTVFAAVVFAAVREAGQIWLAAVAEVAGVVSAAAFSVWMYRREFKTAEPAPWAISARLFREGVPIGLSQILWVVRMFGATLILGFIASAEEVGRFAGALRILIAAHTFVWLYYYNLLPSMARAWQQDRDAFAALIKRSVGPVAWIGVAIGVNWILLAPLVMRSVYGAAFAPAGTTLQWLAAVCVVALLSGHYRFGLIAAGRQNAEMITAAVGAVVAAISIPVGYSRLGLPGVAIGLLVAETAVWCCAWGYSHRLLGLKGQMTCLLRPALSVVLIACLLWSLPFSSAVARIAIANALLIVLPLALDAEIRHLSTGRYDWLRRQVRKSAVEV